MKHLKIFEDFDGSVNLRTLTKLSTLKGGKYPNYTIGKMLEYPDLREYLAYVYLNYDKINFTYDILEKIFKEDVEKFKIQKPGKNLELFQEWKNRFRNKIKEIETEKGNEIKIKPIEDIINNPQELLKKIRGYKIHGKEVPKQLKIAYYKAKLNKKHNDMIKKKDHLSKADLQAINQSRNKKY